jgi:SHS2 domain-containing protein
MNEAPFEEIEHTADWAIRVRGRDLRGLFEAAARGMFSLLVDLAQVAPERELELDLRAIDAETLLVDWLNELLYQSEDKGIAFRDFEIALIDTSMTAHGLAEARLQATAVGGRVHELRRTIKAATFNDLAIRPLDSGYEAEIVFDV